MGLFKSSWERQVDNSLFDFIDVDQFRNHKFSTLWNYVSMWFLLLLHTALYGVDIYTCIRLLAFNTWSSEIQPWLSFKISKWLFSACIICSVVLLIFETVRGLRIYRTRNISLIYTNSFARTLKSIVGYGYYCVLNEVSPTGGFEKMAFYTFFTFHGSKKLILADSPRQVINGITLWTVLMSDNSFFATIKEISLTNRNEALILYGMVISFFIWIFFMANLFFALVFAFPVYYRILHKLRFQSLRQYVCIMVDKTVKKLAKDHQLSSLKKSNKSKEFNSFEKPSIPNIDLPPTPLNSYKASDLSKSSTFDSLSTTLGNNNPFSDTKKPKTTFKDAVQKPIELHHKQSSTSLLTRSDEYPPIKPIIKRPSLQSIDSESSLISQPPQYQSQYSLQQYPQQQLQQQYPTTTDTSPYVRKPPPRVESRPSFDQDLEKGLPYSTSQVSLAESSNYYDDIDNDIDDYYRETSQDRESRSSRRDVRPSLILRAREMESEDYSRFDPVSRTGTFDSNFEVWKNGSKNNEPRFPFSR